MNKETIVRNKYNMPIGRCQDYSDRIIATNYKKGYVGYYNKGTDITFDAKGMIYCYGDATQTLIREADKEN